MKDNAAKYQYIVTDRTMHSAKIYSSHIKTALNNLPEVGRKVKIKYHTGTNNKEKRPNIATRTGIICFKGNRYFTVELQPCGDNLGRYKQAFLGVDLVLQQVKVEVIG